MPKKMPPERFRSIGAKHKAWRITCPVCGSSLSDTNEHPGNSESLRDTSPFGHLWPEALAGEEIIERFLGGDESVEYSPITLMRLLLVQTWRPFTASRSYESSIGWVLGTLFPEFDDLARPIKRRITHVAISTLPIHFRPALLAGISRAMINPDIFQQLRSQTIFRGRKNFDRFHRGAKVADPSSEKYPERHLLPFTAQPDVSPRAGACLKGLIPGVRHATRRKIVTMVENRKGICVWAPVEGLIPLPPNSLSRRGSREGQPVPASRPLLSKRWSSRQAVCAAKLPRRFDRRPFRRRREK
jgi:hypothetical protein